MASLVSYNGHLKMSTCSRAIYILDKKNYILQTRANKKLELVHEADIFNWLMHDFRLQKI